MSPVSMISRLMRGLTLRMRGRLSCSVPKRLRALRKSSPPRLGHPIKLVDGLFAAVEHIAQRAADAHHRIELVVAELRLDVGHVALAPVLNGAGMAQRLGIALVQRQLVC
jgi:hypothetical protein